LRQYYKELIRYYETANTKRQLEYLLEQIEYQERQISCYGKQLFRNTKLETLYELKLKAENKLQTLK